MSVGCSNLSQCVDREKINKVLHFGWLDVVVVELRGTGVDGFAAFDSVYQGLQFAVVWCP